MVAKRGSMKGTKNMTGPSDADKREEEIAVRRPSSCRSILI
jgi:hypothetical protein